MQSYIAILVPEAEGGYSVFFPDVPGCVTQGEDGAEAHAMAVEALSLWMASATDHGMAIPQPRSLEAIRKDKAWAKENEVDFSTTTAILVPVRPPLGKPERVNVSLDSNKLRAIDAYATRRSLTRSAVLEAGAELLMASEQVSAPAWSAIWAKPAGDFSVGVDPVAVFTARLSGGAGADPIGAYAARVGWSRDVAENMLKAFIVLTKKEPGDVAPSHIFALAEHLNANLDRAEPFVSAVSGRPLHPPVRNPKPKIGADTYVGEMTNRKSAKEVAASALTQRSGIRTYGDRTITMRKKK